MAKSAHLRSILARIAGFAAGLLALLAAGVHQGLGGPETVEVLERVRDKVSPALLAQIEAAWIAGAASFLTFGVGLLIAATVRPGLLLVLGGLASAWFAAVAAAFLYAGPRWGEASAAPQVWLLVLMALLSGAAAWLSVARRA